MMTEPDYTVTIEFLSAGIIAATATPDGRLVAIDFASLLDPAKALRLAIPAEQLETLQAALARIQQALADPGSGIRLGPTH